LRNAAVVWLSITSLSELLRNADEKLFSKMRSTVVVILSINCCPRLKHYLWNCAQPIACLLSHNVITTFINLHLFCEICFWTLIEIFCVYTMFIIFVRWRLSVGIIRFTYLFTYLLTYLLHRLTNVSKCRILDNLSIDNVHKM